MKKTNVMVEVSDELYNEVVEPFKKKKGFGKLVVQLLEAYMYNESIYNYINGEMDNLEDEATEVLLKDLNNMAQSLNMFGILGNQAETVINEGQKSIDDFREQAFSDSKKYEEVKEEKQSLTKEDVVDIVNDSVKDIKDMLAELLKNGVVTQPVAEQVGVVVESKIHSEVNKAVVDDETFVVSDSSGSNSNEIVVEEEKEIIVDSAKLKEEEEKAKDALNSLLGSINF